MDKFESKARELLAEVESFLERKAQGQDLRRDSHRFSSAVNDGFLRLLLQIQTLFYLYDPAMPLYLRSLRLGESIEKNYAGTEFVEAKDLLDVFLEMLEFQGVEN